MKPLGSTIRLPAFSLANINMFGIEAGNSLKFRAWTVTIGNIWFFIDIALEESITRIIRKDK